MSFFLLKGVIFRFQPLVFREASQQVLHTFLWCHVCFTLHSGWSLVSRSPSTVTQVVSTSGFTVRNWFVSRVQKHRVLHRNTVLRVKKILRWEKSHMEKKTLGEKIWGQSILPDGNERKNGEKSWSFDLENLDFAWKRWKKWLRHTPWN